MVHRVDENVRHTEVSCEREALLKRLDAIEERLSTVSPHRTLQMSVVPGIERLRILQITAQNRRPAGDALRQKRRRRVYGEGIGRQDRVRVQRMRRPSDDLVARRTG